MLQSALLAAAAVLSVRGLAIAFRASTPTGPQIGLAASIANLCAVACLAIVSFAASNSGRTVRAARFLASGVLAVALVSAAARPSLLGPAAAPLQRLGMAMPIYLIVAYLLLGIAILFVRARRTIFSAVADASVLLLCVINVTTIAAAVYIRLNLIRPAIGSAPAADGVVALFLITFVVFTRRAEHGVFSVLVGKGIGGKVARVVGPFALVLPFIRELARAIGISHGWFMREYGMVIAGGIASTLSFSVAISMALRIDTLERSLHDLSLRDSLTGLYNRRGFYLFAEQALWLARRAQKPFSVLYIDLDDLKRINDTLGHETGSAFIAEIGELLLKTFRETDAIGRIGGDEFAVAGDWDEHGMMLAAQRFEDLVAERNSDGCRSYRLSYSLGQVTGYPASAETLDNLLDRADAAMYAIKQQKKRNSSETDPGNDELEAEASPA